MATIAEKFRGITGDQNSRQIMYVVDDAMSDQDALNLAEQAAPLTYDLMPRQNIAVIEKAKYAWVARQYGGVGEDIEEQDATVADGLYYVQAIYSRQRGTQPVEQTHERPDTADAANDGNFNTFSFEQRLETVRVRESNVTPSRFTAGGNGPPPVPDQTDAIRFGGINTQQDGTVEGVDIQLPRGSFAYDYFPSKGTTINQAYQTLVSGLVGKVNNATFFGREAGTVLFTGVTGRKRNLTDWEFNFQFEYRPNILNTAPVSVGEGSNQIDYFKQGWQYAWVYYDEITETNGAGETRSIKVPRQVNVETLYELADFSVLFPDTTPP